jgi:hypothetical protein
MEAIVKKFRQYGWFVALFEYGINPIGPGWVGKGDLVLVHPGAFGKPIALAIEAKVLSNNNPGGKRAKVLEQARVYGEKGRWLLSSNFLDVRGLPLLAWKKTPDRIMIHRGWQVGSNYLPFVPRFPQDW